MADEQAAVDDQSLKAGSQPSGAAGYRAVVTRGDAVVWTCNHVHFTDHSAKADAQAALAMLQREPEGTASR